MLRCTTLSPLSALIGMSRTPLKPSGREKRGELLTDAIEDVLAVALQVHLVDAHEQVRNAEQRGDVRMPTRLLQHAEPRVDQDDGDVGRRSAGRHVARVLHVPRRIGDDEFTLGGREIAVATSIVMPCSRSALRHR